jgi:hypothetical protein
VFLIATAPSSATSYLHRDEDYELPGVAARAGFVEAACLAIV